MNNQTLTERLVFDDEPVEVALYGEAAPPASLVDVMEACRGHSDVPQEYRKALLAILTRNPEKVRVLNSDQLSGIIDPLLGKASEERCLTFRKLALDCFTAGQFTIAEQLYCGLLLHGFQTRGNLVHLARTLLMQNKLLQARNSIAQAWRQPATQDQLYLNARLLFLRLTFAMLKCKPTANLVHRLEGELRNKHSRMEWTVMPLLEHFSQQLHPDEIAVLKAFAETINKAY